MTLRQFGMHADFCAAQKEIYEPRGWKCQNIKQEAESQEYGACTFEMNGKSIIFRVAKITPTKIGQFVTIWKRIAKGPTMPYDSQDAFDYMVINVWNKDHCGQFVFPKAVLINKGIVSKNGIGGKRGIRVYPAWDITDNPQAKKTQAWQLHYFFEWDKKNIVTPEIIEKLFNN
jgi:hypothetical protein